MAEWAAHGSISALDRQVINTLIEDRDLLGRATILPWPGVEEYSWLLNKTSPDFTFEAETAAHYASQPKRRKMSCRLSYGHGDIQIPIHSSSTLDAAMDMEMEDGLELLRAAGIKISDKLWNGDYITEASVTIYGTGLTATPYVDAIVTLSANTPSGMAGLKYTHVGTFLQYKSPGSTTWGAQVACAADGNYTLLDGDDTTQSVILTVDVTDLAADCTMAGAFLIQNPENMAGLHALAQIDSGQILTVGTDGDAIALSQLDDLEERCLGPKSEKVYYCNKRTRLSIKALLGGVGGTRPEQYADPNSPLNKYDLFYEGVPVAVDSSIAITETRGATTGTCGRIYCVRHNPRVGYHLYAGAHHGPNEGVISSPSSDHSMSGDGLNPNIQIPVYMRRLPEGDTKQFFKWRASVAIAAVLRRSTSLSMKYGVTN